MLELMKTVLENVSNDADYFKKEFQKATQWLSEEELKELIHYTQTKLGKTPPLEFLEAK